MSEFDKASIPEGHSFIQTRSGRHNRRRKSGNLHGTNTSTNTGGGPDVCGNSTDPQRALEVDGLSRREANRDLRKILKAHTFSPVRRVPSVEPKEVPEDWVLPPSTPTTESCVRGTFDAEGLYTDRPSSSTIIPPLEDSERSKEHQRILFEALGHPISLLYSEERLEERLQGLPSPLNIPAFVKARVKPLFDDVHLGVLRGRQGGDRDSSVRFWELAGNVVDNVASGRALDDVSRHRRPQGRPRTLLRMSRR